MRPDYLSPAIKMRELYEASNDLYCGQSKQMATKVTYRARCKNCGKRLTLDEPAPLLGALCSDKCAHENSKHYL